MRLHKIDISFGLGLKVGFATVLLLLVTLMVISLYSVYQIDRHLNSIVKHSVVKANLANIMQTSLRERAISMHSMAAMDDPFDKDEEFLHFNRLGTQFLIARKQMEQQPLDATEKQVIADLVQATRLTQPLVRAIIEKTLRAETVDERIEVSNQIYKNAVPNQHMVAEHLDHLVKLQEEAIRIGTVRAHTAYIDARNLILVLGLMASGMGFLVALFAIKNATRQTDRLQHQAMFDDLTGLPNRVLFQDRLQQAIPVSRRESQPFALLALDLNRFKSVNDTLGHQYGDLLLQQVGERLRTASRESDTVARMGGDEFSFLLPATDIIGSKVFAQKVLHVLEASFDLKGKNVEIGASIGVAVFPENGLDYESLTRHADAAMYVAKRAHSGVEMYDSSKAPDDELDFALRTELRLAIEHNELVLYFQPKISHVTSKISGLEALVRWQHPTHGMILPDKFIPLAEQTGLIRPLTSWVLEHAISQCAQLHALGIELTMAVNLSTLNLKDPTLPGKITAALEKHQLEAKWLELEITESAVMDDTMRTVQVLAELDRLGARISIDDYGTGYSSLSYFRKLPLDDLKIDKSFVIGMGKNHEDATIVRSTIEMGHELGLHVVAEGVEDRETWEKLTLLGCDAAQGYYMSRPLSSVDLLKWLCESPWGISASESTSSTKDSD